ncbi:MAG: SMP-30/gluconolactonase/LRE family protein [Fimbriimonadales bacterium]
MLAVILASVVAGSDLIEPGATLQKLGSGYAFAEGPAVDAKGDVFFTDQPNDRILRWDVDGSITEWMKPCGRANGMRFDRHGFLLACCDEQNQLWRITADRQSTVLAKDFQGKLLNGPNDVWVRPDNGVYLTDPLYARPYWKRDPKPQQPGQYVFFLSVDRKALNPVDRDLKMPNGIIGTADGRILYVSDIGDGKTYRYRISGDGSLTDKTLFCSLGSDGMTMDSRGDVYLTGHGVTVFDKTGKQIEHIDVPESWTGNITFAGKDRHLLFMTATHSVYGLRMRVMGSQ